MRNVFQADTDPLWVPPNEGFEFSLATASHVNFPQWLFLARSWECMRGRGGVNEGREKAGRQGYRKRRGDTTGQHAVREASMPLLSSQGTELVSPKVLDPRSSRWTFRPCHWHTQALVFLCLFLALECFYSEFQGWASAIHGSTSYTWSSFGTKSSSSFSSTSLESFSALEPTSSSPETTQV